MRRYGWIFGALLLLACGGQSETPEATAETEGELVTDPPFEVRGDAEGLLLVYFDEEGVHSASARHEIPEERRGEVRVDSLSLPPDQRDPDHVFIADLRAPGPDGRYPMRRLPRAAFDARVSAYGAEPDAPAAGGALASADVVVFGASWCGACRSTEAFLRERGVPFVERDIEREPGAREDMQRRAAAAGVSPTGIPVIDFRGRIIQGFNRGALERAIRETSPPPGAPATDDPSGPGVSI